MFYWLAKILTFLFQPSSLAALAIAAGVRSLVRRPDSRWGRRLALGGLAWVVVAGVLPVGNLVIIPLEERFAHLPRPKPSDNYKGIIILGGAEDGWVSEGRGQLALNEAAERFTEAVRLARELPGTKVMFTGGVGSMWGGQEATGSVMRFLLDAGIAAERIETEAVSRNTHENALMASEVLKPRPGDRWLLVTSAYHMPRSIGLFRKAGFDVSAYPVDFRTRDKTDFKRPFDRLSAGLIRADTAVNEWIGLVAYRLTGRIDDLFPAP